MLVMGRQLCGKTTTLAAIGQAITQRFTPEQAQITVIDPKTTLIGKIRGPHVRAYAYTADDIDAVIAELAAELRDRLPPSGLTQEELLNLQGVGRPAPVRPDRRRTRAQAAQPGGETGGDRAAVAADRAQPASRFARDSCAAAWQLGRSSRDESVPAENDGISVADLVHGQRSGKCEGFRADQRSSVAARAWPIGHDRGRYRGSAGGDTRIG